MVPYPSAASDDGEIYFNSRSYQNISPWSYPNFVIENRELLRIDTPPIGAFCKFVMVKRRTRLNRKLVPNLY